MSMSTNRIVSSLHQQQPLLPLDFVPALLRTAGLADAHERPLVGVRTPDGVRSFRVAPVVAWREDDPFPLIEWPRTGNTTAALVLDLDDRVAIEKAHACSMGAGPLPVPNVTITRRSSGHVHCGWMLRTPVHRGAGARTKPLTLFGRVSEYYRQALGADAGYVGVLASNPVDTANYETAWVRQGAYELSTLARALPSGWRMPAVPTTAAGRNCAVFRMSLRFAGNLNRSDDEVAAFIREAVSVAENEWSDVRDEHDRITEGEIVGIVRSVLRYRSRWRSTGHQPAFLFRQAARGRRGGIASGTVRAVRAMDRAAEILTANAAGATISDLARRFDVSRWTVQRALRGDGARSQYR